MSVAAPIAIDGVGMITSLGVDAAQTTGSLRSRLQRFAELAFVDDAGDECTIITADRQPLVAGAVAIPFSEARGPERILVMGGLALAEAARTKANEAAPLVLCVPEPPVVSLPFSDLARSVAERADVKIDFESSKAFAEGRASLAPAIIYVRKLFASGKVSHCYLGATDSLLLESRIYKLMDARRINFSANPNGFVPGEGAAFLRLSPKGNAQSLALIRGVGWAKESDTGKPSIGTAASTAIRLALADAGITAANLGLLVHDIAGERQLFKEWSLAIARMRVPPAHTLDEWSPALYLGEIGAAIGPVSVGALAFLMGKGIFCESGAMHLDFGDAGGRSAVILSRARR